MAMPSASATTPPAKSTARKGHRRLFEVVAGTVILLLLLLVGGICAAADLKPAMSIDPTIAVPGDTVTIVAARLPAHQFGQIQLHSNEMYPFAFQADGKGDFRQPIVIPSSLTTGMHQVFVCWGGSCPLEKPLRIVAPGTLPSATPSSNPSPSASGKPGTTPSPRRSPRPGSSPTSNPTSSPGPTPIPQRSPSPSPTPTANPCPTSAAPAALNASPNPVVGGGTVKITGTNFTPNKSVTVTYYKGSSLYAAKTLTVGCNGSFSTTVTTPGGVVRTDHVTAADTAGRRASVSISIIL